MVMLNNNRVRRRQRNKDLDESTNRGQVKNRKIENKKIKQSRNMPS